MRYEFVSEADGTRVELDMPMRDAPAIGSVILHEGRSLRRIASVAVQIDPGHNRNMFPRVSRSLPRNAKGCEKDKRGLPIVRSRKHEADLCSRYGLVKE